MTRHIHLDAIGGISGDMFVGAMLDCMPVEAGVLEDVIVRAGFPDMVELDLQSHDDGALTGTALRVREVCHAGDTGKGNSGEHPHRHYAEIRGLLENSELDSETRSHALGIFRLLAQAEADVHGKSVDDVAFHEVGAWDSIADIVLAAWLITRCGAGSWSVSSLPAGSGEVTTAHGRLPVPVPAVTVLLEGFRFHDDGLQGERVTPTGAAILRYLAPTSVKPPAVLAGSGYGFGTRKLSGLSNVLRATMYDLAQAEHTADWKTDRICELAFEVDDQSGEDLAHALDTIRNQEGVLDVLTYPALGKKGRTVHCVRVLCLNEVRATVTTLCFNQTATLGIREESITRHSLQRMLMSVQVEGYELRVKLAQRPSGAVTIKAEMDDLAASGLDHAARERLRVEAEQAVLDQLAGDAGGVDEDEPDAG